MRRISLSRLVFASGFVVALIPLLLSAAAPDSATSKPPLSPAEKVRNDLDQTISVRSLEGTTLKDALDYLAKKKQFNFEIDNRAFLDEGLKDALQVTVDLPEMKDVKVSQVLRRLLAKVPVAPSEAVYVIVGDTVVITTSAQAPYQWMHQTINLDCEKADLASVLKKLAHETGTNLVIDARAAKAAQTLVSLQMQDVPLEMAVYLLADMAGLQPVRVGNMLYLTTKANVIRMRADPELAQVIGPCPLPADVKVPALP